MQRPPPPQVTVSKPVKKLVAEHDEYVGRFVAVDYVEVRARVSGYLQTIHFTDGQLVKKDDPLFTIDPRPFQASLDQAKAAVEQAKANLAFAESRPGARREPARAGTTITQQALDQRVQAKRVASRRGHRRRRRPSARPSSICSSPSSRRPSPAASATGASPSATS